MNAHVTLLVCVMSLGQDTIDPARLHEIREGLESYLSRITSLRLEYDFQWTAADPGLLVKARDQVIVELRRRQAERGLEPVQESKVREPRSVVHRSEVLLYQPPNIRQEYETLLEPGAGPTEGESRALTYYDKKYTQTDLLHKAVHLDTKGRMDVELVFSQIPVHALGLVLPRTPSQPLSSLLQFPDITREVGQETIGRLKTIVLTIGPGVPAGVRPVSASESYEVRLNLAPELDYLPLKATYSFVKGFSITTELADFQDARDLARKANLQFPHSLAWTDPGGVWRWNVKNVVVNPRLTVTDFSPTFPADFMISRDGGPFGPASPTGRAGPTRQVARKIANKGAELLAASPAPAAGGWGAANPMVPALLATLVLFLTLFMYVRKRRRTHDAP